MRGQALIDHVTTVFHNAFGLEVAEALTSDEDTLESLAQHLSRECGDDIAAALQPIADQLDDDTADWLVERAENPAAWLYSRVRPVLVTN